jgi:Zinc-binding dehydrogenase
MARDWRISPLIHRVIALEDVADAHRELAAGGVVGKIVIEPAPNLSATDSVVRKREPGAR